VTAAWTSGYVADVAYTLGFYRELAPSFLNYACLVNGVEGLPRWQGVRYCELGCGRGYGTLLLAAANPDMAFVGIDFNPSHIAEARSLAKRANISNAAFMDFGFGDAARSDDPRLSEFDVVTLHGVYAWVEPGVRAEIHDFLRSKLAPGGLAYLTYNALPGWAALLPVQRLFMEVAHRSVGDTLARVKKGRELLNTLAAKSGRVVSQNSYLRSYLGQLNQQGEQYLAHEFIVSGWRPMFVVDVMEMLSEAKLTYVGSASIGENRLGFCVPNELRELVESAPDRAMRELLKDYAINKSFRRDIYAKGVHPLSRTEERRRLSALTFALAPGIRNVPERIRIPLGEAPVNAAIMQAVWDCVATKAATGAELFAAATKAGAKDEHVWQLIEMLVHAATLLPGRPDAAQVDGAASRRLNHTVMDLALSADSHRYLASPVLGSAIGTSLLERVVAPLLVGDPMLDDATLVARALARANGLDADVAGQDRAPEKDDQKRATLVRAVRQFRDQRLPRWRSLKVID
jgi:SAM-dependent methyltransferase